MSALLSNSVSGLLAGGVIAAILSYLKDRHKAKAAGKVAVATVDVTIDEAHLQNLEHRFDLAVKAWTTERQALQAANQFLTNEVVNLRTEVGRLTEELTKYRNT